MSDKQRWLEYFQEFISHLSIDSKETGITPLGGNLYGAQTRFLEEVCAGLDDGIRHFTVLKARQLGISTVSLAMDLFWLLVHPGMQGALITDTDGNRDRFKIILTRYLESIPKKVLGNITVKQHNRNSLVLSNGSVLDYLVAGVKKGGAGLARSRALNFVHATEMSSWGDPEGVDSLKAAMAEKHPNRLYIFESTAKGFNLFWEMWEAAKKDHHTQRAIFIGWWAKEDYAIAKSDSRFKEYWDGTITNEEEAMLKLVNKDYGVDITPEQLAWYRWNATSKITGQGMIQQEMPSFEADAFISTGQHFFPPGKIARDFQGIRDAVRSGTNYYRGARVPFKAYRYQFGTEFETLSIHQVHNAWEADLRVWEEPVAGAEYVMGIDPAYGRNDNKDNHSISVLRCYADRVIQVAEYTTHVPETYVATWVMAHLAGYYHNVILNLEINGPGKTIMGEMKHLRQMMDKGVISPGHERPINMSQALAGARWYLYHRPDSPGNGFVYNFQTTVNTKHPLMDQMRDAYVLDRMVVVSEPLLGEMQRIVQEGSSIEAEGSAKDDRVLAFALALEAWVKWVRPGMIEKNMTFERVTEMEKRAEQNPRATLVGNVIQQFYAEQSKSRKTARINSMMNVRKRR